MLAKFGPTFYTACMPRPPQYDDDLRRRLLDAASRMISTAGAHRLSLRSLATQAGTSTAAVYALFGGRGDLLQAVTAEGQSRFAAHLAAVAPTEDAATDLLELGVAYRTSALADPHFYRIMFGSTSGSDLLLVQAEQDDRPQQTLAVLREAVGRLELLPPQVRRPRVAVLFGDRLVGDQRAEQR